MTISIHRGGQDISVTGVGVHVGGALKMLAEGWQRTGGSLKQFYAIIAVGLSATSAIGRGNSATVLTVTTNAITAIPSGAIGTIAYAWARTDSDPQAWTINNPATASASFSTVCDQGESFDATFSCTITDQAGQTVTSANVAASCANIFYGGGFKGSIPPTVGEAYP